MIGSDAPFAVAASTVTFNTFSMSGNSNIVFKRIFSKTLAVNKDLFKGHKLMIDDLETKKPGNLGVSAENYRKVLGKKLKRDLKRNSFLKSFIPFI